MAVKSDLKVWQENGMLTRNSWPGIGSTQANDRTSFILIILAVVVLFVQWHIIISSCGNIIQMNSKESTVAFLNSS